MKNIIYLSVLLLLITSCVAKSDYSDLQDENSKLQRELEDAKTELSDKKYIIADLEDKIEQNIANSSQAYNYLVAAQHGIFFNDISKIESGIEQAKGCLERIKTN